MSADSRESPFGHALLVATLGCAAAAVPAALRSSGGSVPFAMAWLALWGSMALMVAPVAGAWRLARPLAPSAWSLPLGLAFSLAPLLVLARVLKTATHHRPLGGATFALVAAMVVLGAAAVAARVISWSKDKDGLARSTPVGLGLLGLCLGVPLALPVLGTPLRGSFLDGALCLAVAAAGAFAPSRDKVGRVGPILLWIAALGLSLGVGLRSAPTRSAVEERAPVLVGLLVSAPR